MLEFLTGAVVLLAVVSLVNLLLTFGVIRRLREKTQTQVAATAAMPDVMTAPVGQQIGEFHTTAVSGETVSRAELPGPSLFGFFSPQCDACHERLPEFRAAALAHPGRTVAVVIRDGGDVESLVSELDSSLVVVEDLGGALSGAFGVQGFPAFARLDEDGTLLSRGYEPPRPLPV